MKQMSWNAPWWAWSLSFGPTFGIGQGAWAYADGRYSVMGAVVFGVVEGLFFGAVMGPFTARRMGRQSRSVGEVPYDQQKAVTKAANRGPVPRDPFVRDAAARLAAYLAEQGQRRIWLNVGLFVAGAALSVCVSVLEEQPAWLLGTLLFGALAVWVAVLPRHYRHRAMLLRG